jgi:K(+)-stimulated pyrophosphate-energized sodium pump
MNILIKLTCLVGLVIAPILGEGHTTEGLHESHKEISVSVNASSNEQDEVTATVAYTITENGETKTVERVFEGTEASVQEELAAFQADIDSQSNEEISIEIQRMDVRK